MIGNRFFGALVALVLLPAAALAEEVLLTITGVGEPIEFDRDELAALESATITTTTIWTDGVQKFTGVPLDALVEAIGVEDGILRATAINAYAVDVPVADAVEGGPILAYARNGEEMSVRDKGPLWLVYPYDARPEYQSEVIYSRSIWQLDRIEVVR